MAILRYTLLRLLILAVVTVLVWLVLNDLGMFWVLLISIFISGIISIFVLRRSRDEVSAQLDRRVSTIKSRLEERVAAEDAWDDMHRQDLRRDDVHHAGPQRDHAHRDPQRDAAQGEAEQPDSRLPDRGGSASST